MKTFRRVLWGLVLVALGVILGLKAFGVIDFDIFFKGWWTLFIIVPCFIGLFDREGQAGNLVGIVAGVLLLLASQEVIDFESIWQYLLPAILVIAGIAVILAGFSQKKIREKIKKINEKKSGKDEKDMQAYVAVFGGESQKLPKGKFDGCSVTAVFGGAEIDLMNVTVAKDAVVSVNAVFGGVTVRVPKGTRVECASTSLFGGVQNKVLTAEKGKGEVLYIDATCVFGGVEVTDQTEKEKKK